MAIVTRSRPDEPTSPLKTNHGSAFAACLLFIMILSIAVSPRISLGLVDAEIRSQDILIFPAMLYLLLSPKPAVKRPVYRLLGNLLQVFVYTSVVTVLLAMVFVPDVAIVRRVLYFGRTLEMLFLAVVIAGLYLRSRVAGMKVVLRGINLGALLNLAWFGYQVATGDSTTLIGQEFSERIESYGPRLIGEPSAFGTGQYWAFIAAAAAAQIKSGRRPAFNLFLFGAAFWACWLSQSRISIGSIIVIAGILLILGRDRKSGLNIFGVLFGSIIVLYGLLYMIPLLGGRLTPDSLASSFRLRVETIWKPMLDLVASNPLTGVGPGGLIGAGRNMSEAHNIIIRAMLDFGIIVGIIFIVLFIRAMVKGFRLARTPGIDKTLRTAGYLGAFAVLSTLVSGQVQDALTAVMSSHLTMVAIGILAAAQATHFDKPGDQELVEEQTEKAEQSKREKKHRALANRYRHSA